MAPEAVQFSSNISDVGIQKYLWETRNVFLVLLSTFKHFKARFGQFIGNVWKITYFVAFLCPSSKSRKSLEFFQILKTRSEMDYESPEPSNLTWMQCYDQKWFLRISQKLNETPWNAHFHVFYAILRILSNMWLMCRSHFWS